MSSCERSFGPGRPALKPVCPAHKIFKNRILSNAIFWSNLWLKSILFLFEKYENFKNPSVAYCCPCSNQNTTHHCVECWYSSLKIKKMARKIYDPNEDENTTPSDELQIQSRELYANFVREEIELQGLPVPDVPLLVFFLSKSMFFYH